MTDVKASDLQPRGNAAAQERVKEGACSDWAAPACESASDLWAWAFGDEHSDWWTAYKAAATEARQAMVLDAWHSNALHGHLDALTEEQSVDPAHYRNELGEVLDYYQHLEMMRSAGMTWEEMLDAQRTWMTAESRRRVADAGGEEDVTDSELQAAHAESVGDQDYYTDTPPEQTEWAQMTEEEQRAWRMRAHAAIAIFVEWAETEHPELQIKPDEVVPALKRCEELNAVAFVENGMCHISRKVVVAIERDPAYALSTIQHELRGHPEFDTGFSVAMELYDGAASGMPGYSRSAEGSEARNAEWARYEYFDSEIGALMREQSYWVDAHDVDRDGTLEGNEQNPLGNPVVLLDSLLSDLKTNWEPTLLQAYLSSMLRRFEADPRIGDAACTAFAEASLRNLGITP